MKSHFLLFAVLYLLTGCSVAPQYKIDALANKYEFQRIEVQGTQFTHLVYRKNFHIKYPIVHVYLEGDGLPWAMRDSIARDPTPRRPLMLRLMSLDDRPSLYLGRPCYHGFSTQTPCNPVYWTVARYSEEIVQSMVAVLTEQIKSNGFNAVRLFGHSGGGTLALLIAERVAATRTVVSLAGNLDIDAWARHHNYSPLFLSLNPAERPPLPVNIEQIHLLAARDNVIPPYLVRDWARKQANTTVKLYDNFDHGCCWQNIWPDLLYSLKN